LAICKLCEEVELSKKSRLETCKNCRASMGVWSRRPAAEVLRRRQRLHVYDMRMEMVVLHPRNVTKQPAMVKPFVSAAQLKKQRLKERSQQAAAGR
jgi:hypothetical protein